MVDLLDYRASIRAAHRVLRPGGRFVGVQYPSDAVRRLRWIRVTPESGGRKFDSTRWMVIGMRGRGSSSGGVGVFVNMHRTLSSYVSAFLEAGFVLEGLDEPVPSEGQLVDESEFFDD